ESRNHSGTAMVALGRLPAGGARMVGRSGRRAFHQCFCCDAAAAGAGSLSRCDELECGAIVDRRAPAWLKREELIAANSMILHELFFDGLGGDGRPSGAF